MSQIEMFPELVSPSTKYDTLPTTSAKIRAMNANRQGEKGNAGSIRVGHERQSSINGWVMNGDSKPRRSIQEAGRLSRSSNRSRDCVDFIIIKLTQTAIPGQAQNC